MRGLGAFLLVGLLTGCEEDRTFDDQFDETANQIEKRAATMDAEARGDGLNSMNEVRPPKAP